MALILQKVTVDGNEYAKIKDGKPLYVDDVDNKELAIDAEASRVSIATLNNEAAQNRNSIKASKDALALFGDAKPDEIAALRTTLTELGGPEGLAKLKEAGKTDVEAIKKSITDVYEGKLSEANKTGEAKDTTIRGLLVGNGFATSKFLEGTVFKDTRDVAESYFGKYFQVENGKAVAYDGDQVVFSRENGGTPATVNEALEYFIGKHPQRDSFLLSSGGGSGAQQNNGGKGGDGKSITRADFLTKSPAEQSALSIARVTITD